jgi:UDP-N-acetylmuramyl tripeptide synthase
MGDGASLEARSARDPIAAAAARLTARASRATGAGAGTTLPGRVAERLSPGFLERRTAGLRDGVVLVSGTNGKTTTTSMIAAMVAEAGAEPVSNRSGANMTGGIASAFVHAPGNATAAVLEVDEAVLPTIVRRVRPRALVLTNVFRDQLDRFGEPERVAALLARSAEALPADAVAIANADDPLLWHALRERDPIGFGVSEADVAGGPGGPPHPATSSGARGSDPGFDVDADGEPATCPACGTDLTYARRSFGHLGAASCAGCGWRSARPRHLARVVATGGLSGIVLAEGDALVTLPLGGIHNAYNATAALAAAAALGVPRVAAIAALERFVPRFGRSEGLELNGRRLWLGLIKNPAGTGAVVRTVAGDAEVGAVVVAVNDRDADGRDVSWIWDAGFERLAASGVPVLPAGRRAEEVALRLKYAGADPAPVEHEPGRAIAAAAERCAEGRMVAVLATYTAMLEARRTLLRSRAARVEDRQRDAGRACERVGLDGSGRAA